MFLVELPLDSKSWPFVISFVKAFRNYFTIIVVESGGERTFGSE